MKKWNVAAVRAAKGKTKLGCCTAYDTCFARLADEAGVPIILVGDSLGMNCLGYETTLPVNMSDTLAAVAAVARGAKDAMVVGDMPFGSYQCGDDEAVKNAVAIIKAGADAVKLEGGASVYGLIRRLSTAGIPVLAHVGMMPTFVNEYGGFRKQGKTREAAEKVLADAKAVEEAGAFAVTLECIPSELAAEIGRSAGMMLDEEALRVVNASPKWKPGKIRGRKVRASISIPVEFKLEKKSSRNTIGIKK